MTRDVILYVSDILTNMDEAMSYLEGMSYEQFVKDTRTSKAVIRSIEIMGEAVKHISDEIRSMRRDVPWREIARMRDKCIHFYFGVDYEIVWNAVKEHIPRLRPMLQSLLDELRTSEH